MIEVENEIKDFHQWISELSIVNFSDYESVWTKPHKFRGLYRLCCYRYYRSEALCDVYRSRITTKQSSASFLYQFIQGMLQPKEFYRFKWFVIIMFYKLLTRYGCKNFKDYMNISNTVTLRGLMRRYRRKYPTFFKGIKFGFTLCGTYVIVMSLIPGCQLPFQK